ncbi:MAG: hypothetical protein AB1716_19275 [Planctomycetota bacterium]
MSPRSRTRKVLRSRTALLALVAVAGFGLGGCPPAPSGDLLGMFSDYLPTAEELRAYEQQMIEFQQQQENLPLVHVRIVNNTSAAAVVMLNAGLTMPTPPGVSGLSFYPEDESFSTPVDDRSVLVAAHGTATGTILCGETISIGVTAPLDSLLAGFGSYSSSSMPWGPGGNLALTGVGSVGEDPFTGAVIHTSRVVRPATDGLDCATGTLVITIQTAASTSVYDPVTGALLQGATPGAAVLSIE